jgi:hypothetical protein
MGKECGKYGVKERCIQDFAGATFEEPDHLEDLCVDGSLILKWFLKTSVQRA